MSASSSVPKKVIETDEKSYFDKTAQAAEKKSPQKLQGDALATPQAINHAARGDIETVPTGEADSLDGIDENDSIGG